MCLTSYQTFSILLAMCQEPWQNFFVARDRARSADELREVLLAEAKLAELELYTDVALAIETEPLAEVRAQYAAEYRRLLGISAADGSEFRASLESIREGSCSSVVRVLQDLNAKHQENGLNTAPAPAERD